MKNITKISLGLVYFYIFIIGFNISFTLASVNNAQVLKADSKVGYFVAQSPLINAAKPISVSSPFWSQRNIGGSSPHGGIDLVVDGKPGEIYGYGVYAMADGEVIKTQNSCPDNGGMGDRCGGGHGNQVAIYHGTHKVLNQNGKEVTSEIITLAAHMKKGSTGHLKAGDTVKAGEKLGEVANSGSSQGDHLHLEMYAPGNAGKSGNFYGGDKTSAQPYIWPEGDKDGPNSVDIAFKPEPILYNALGVKQGPGSKASGIGNSGGGDELTQTVEEIKQAVNDEWKTPLVNFQEREYQANPKGIQDGRNEAIGASTVVGFSRLTNNIYEYSKVITLFMTASFMFYMAIVTIYYLVLLPRSSASWKHADLFEKATGINAVVTKKNTLDIIGRDIVSIIFIAFVLSGAYTNLFVGFYAMIAAIF